VWSIDVGHNVALGMLDTEIVSGKYQFGPENVLFLYTDGLTEAVDEHRVPLGGEKLAEYFSRIAATQSGRGTHAMREAMLAALRGYRGSRLTTDDSTFLMARRRLSLRPPA
jgi:serine phosphatase RsbU (regulator of sigma subunit)